MAIIILIHKVDIAFHTFFPLSELKHSFPLFQKTKSVQNTQTTKTSTVAPEQAKAPQPAAKPASAKPAGAAKTAEGDENFDYSDFEIEDESI